MVIVMGMIAVIPATSQPIFGSDSESADTGNLPMLILVNRLNLSDEQMQTLYDIISDLPGNREAIDVLRAEFEDVMIEFNGTDEQLDELLITFRQDQLALMEQIHASVAAALDDIRDLLSINQGMILRQALPRLLGAGNRRSFDQVCDRFGDGSMPGMTQQRFGGDAMSEMMEQRFGRRGHGRAVDDVESMIEQQRTRIKNMMLEQGDRRQPGTGAMQPLQSFRGRGLAEHGSPFELFQQLADVLKLKLEAME